MNASTVASIDRLINSVDQYFICREVEEEIAEVEVPIYHDCTLALPESERIRLIRDLDLPNDFKTWLSHYSSVDLYCDTESGVPAFRLAAPNEWLSLYREFKIWLEDLDDAEQSELVPDWVTNSIAFGELPTSGNCYLIPLSGSERGAVYEFCNDGFRFERRSQSLNDFVRWVSTPTRELLEYIPPYARYSFGGNASYIPVSYGKRS